MNRVGGTLEGVLLWFLWLRRGRIGSVTSELRRYDRKNRPAEKISDLAGILIITLPISTWLSIREVRAAEAEKKAKAAMAASPMQGEDARRESEASVRTSHSKSDKDENILGKGESKQRESGNESTKVEDVGGTQGRLEGGISRKPEMASRDEEHQRSLAYTKRGLQASD